MSYNLFIPEVNILLHNPCIVVIDKKSRLIKNVGDHPMTDRRMMLYWKSYSYLPWSTKMYIQPSLTLIQCCNKFDFKYFELNVGGKFSFLTTLSNKTKFIYNFPVIKWKQ